MKRYRIYSLLLIVLVFSVVLVGCSYQILNISEDYSNKLIVHFIDVGQGDSTLIEFPNGKISLIDGGTRGASDKVIDYIDSLGIRKIDYLIATHPHEDHIGGLPKVIRNFDIDKVYMPDKTANTIIFEELLLEIKKKNLKINLAEGGDTIIDDKNLRFSILAPNKNTYSNINDFSIVTKIEYGHNSVIITGDAESCSEKDMLDLGYDLTADILRVGHHGGSTSSTEEFLTAVDPDYSILSVGKGNPYGHPHRETLNRLANIETQVMRTDKLGDIVFVSDGKKFKWMKDLAVKDNDEEQYTGNKNTKIFHHIDCKSLPNKKNQIMFRSIKEAQYNGYRPHKVCME
ncbi:MAG TPA: MBL fold metallo-hydrolase [Tepidimicrobium sp.]|nr:MBL fold metallo-hydrolase [Tepidimicrobium sp.]